MENRPGNPAKSRMEGERTLDDAVKAELAILSVNMFLLNVQTTCQNAKPRRHGNLVSTRLPRPKRQIFPGFF